MPLRSAFDKEYMPKKPFRARRSPGRSARAPAAYQRELSAVGEQGPCAADVHLLQSCQNCSCSAFGTVQNTGELEVLVHPIDLRVHIHHLADRLVRGLKRRSRLTLRTIDYFDRLPSAEDAVTDMASR